MRFMGYLIETKKVFSQKYGVSSMTPYLQSVFFNQLCLRLVGRVIPAVVLMLNMVSLPVYAEMPASLLKVGVLNAPFMGYIDDQGVMTGFEVDLANAICAKLQQPCDIHLQPFQVNLEQVQNNQLSFAVSSFLVTPERQQKNLFSDRYMRSYSSYLGTLEQPKYRAVRVGVVKGSTQERYLLQKKAGSIQTISFMDIQSTYDALMNHEVDQVLFPAIIQLKFINEHPELDLELLGDPLQENSLGGEVAIGLPFGQEVLRDRINQVIKTLLTDGTYNKINKHYFPFNVY